MTGDPQVFLSQWVSNKHDYFAPYSVYLRAIERVKSVTPAMVFGKVRCQGYSIFEK